MGTAGLELLAARAEHVSAAALGARALSQALGGAAVADDWERFPGAIAAIAARRTDEPPWCTHLFLLDAPRTLVGWGGFKGPPGEGVVELGYAVAPEVEGRGVATDAVRQLLRLASPYAAVHTVTAHTLPEPGPSPRVLEKAGFERGATPTVASGRSVWRWSRVRPS